MHQQPPQFSLFPYTTLFRSAKKPRRSGIRRCNEKGHWVYVVIRWLPGRALPGLPVRCALRNPCCFIGMGLLLGRFSQDRVEAAAGARSQRATSPLPDLLSAMYFKSRSSRTQSAQPVVPAVRPRAGGLLIRLLLQKQICEQIPHFARGLN